MEDDPIRLAFSKVKHDIRFLEKELLSLKQELRNITHILQNLTEEIKALKTEKTPKNTQFQASTDTSTLRHINTTDTANSTHNSTVPQEIGGLKSQNLGISTGNQGASTDRQTDTSTDKNCQKTPKNDDFKTDSIESNIQEASEILDSLDRLKKEIRLKFKGVTNQEMAVFSSIYQLEEEDPDNTTYKNIAESLKLSESSIRDYVQRMINKGIPIKKNKLNNKKIILSISQDLRKIATLSTIIQLRDL